MNKIVKAFSKTNLFLNVSPQKFNDTLKHKLESLMIKNKYLFDEVIINEANETKITYLQNEKQIYFDDDSCLKALNWFNKYYGKDLKLEILVKKMIPVGSGLGGESTDAASILGFCFDYYHIMPNDIDRRNIALFVGSDVCFFLDRYNLAFVGGFGDVVQEIINVDIKYELIIPDNLEISTKQIYEKFDNSDISFSRFVGLDKILKIIESQQYELLFNNLQEIVLNSNEELKNIFNIVKEKNPKNNIMISGAGSTIIKLIKDKKYE